MNRAARRADRIPGGAENRAAPLADPRFRRALGRLAGGDDQRLGGLGGLAPLQLFEPDSRAPDFLSHFVPPVARAS